MRTIRSTLDNKRIVELSHDEIVIKWKAWNEISKCLLEIEQSSISAVNSARQALVCDIEDNV